MNTLQGACVWLAAVACAWGAQHGGVVKSGGHPIPGATVIASMERQRLSTVTGEDGRYAFDDLPAGIWMIEVRMFGFAPTGRPVTVGATPGATDFSLEVAAAVAAERNAEQAAETMEMRVDDPGGGDAGRLSGDSANESFLVNGSMSRGLEQAAREDAFFRERVSASPAEPQAPAIFNGAGDPAASGRTRAVNPKKAAAAPSKKKEPGQKSRTTQAATRVFGNRTRRSRTSQMRGMAYASIRNSALDARPYSLSGLTFPKPNYAQNRYGAAIGGPLTQATFFFLNYTGTRSRNPYSAFATLPSPGERAGDFSQSQAYLAFRLYDPTNGQPFANNILPANRVDPAARGLLRFIPQLNQPGSIQNYQIATSAPRNDDNLSVRINQRLSRRDRIDANYQRQWRDTRNVQLFGFRDTQDGKGFNLALGWTHNVTRRIIHNLRWTFSRNRNETTPFFAFGSNVAAELGIAGTSQDPINYGPPNLNFTNFGDLTDASPVLRRDQTSGIVDSLTLARRRHTFSFGLDYKRLQVNSFTEQNARGSFTFSGLKTSALDRNGQPLAGTGFDFADFLLGLPQSSSIRFGAANNYFRASNWAWFAQDDWRMRTNLTLNLGLRWEYFEPFRELRGQMANLDIRPGFTGVAPVLPGESGPYSGAFPEALIDGDRNNFSPRAGIAWRPFRGSSTVVRAGYSVFHNGSVYNGFATRLASQPPFARTGTLTTSLARTLTLQNGFAPDATQRITNTFAVNRGYRVGYAQTWNLSIQQSLPHSLVLELGYLATKGTKLDLQRQPNRAAPGSPLTAEQRRQIGNAVGFTYDTSEGGSIYHAAQVRVTRRMRSGVSANALYTFSKSIDNASSLGGGGNQVAQNDNDLRSERGLSTFDQRHQLALYYMLESPIGERSSLLPAGTVANLLLRDWTFSGGVTAATGQPLTARVLGNQANAGGTGAVGSGRADSTGAAVTGGRFFDTAAFTLPPSGRFGNAGRNTIPGPSRLILNLSLGRSFRMGDGRRRVEFRVESNNLANHVNYSGLGTVVNAINYGLATNTMPMRTMSAMLRYRF